MLSAGDGRLADGGGQQVRTDDVAADEVAAPFGTWKCLSASIRPRSLSSSSIPCQIAGLTDGGHDQVSFDVELELAFDRGLAVSFHFWHAKGLGATIVALDDLSGIQLAADVDAFTGGILDLVLGSRHFLDTGAGDQRHIGALRFADHGRIVSSLAEDDVSPDDPSR